jgi:hypothetical protein
MVTMTATTTTIKTKATAVAAWGQLGRSAAMAEAEAQQW